MYLIVSLSIVVLLVVRVHRLQNKYIYLSQNNIMLYNIKNIFLTSDVKKDYVL